MNAKIMGMFRLSSTGRFVLVVLAVLTCLCPGSSHAGEPTLEEVLTRHCLARESTTVLQAKFTQTKIFTVFEEEETSKGVFSFAQPDRICWQYTEPDRSSTVINGQNGWSVFPHIKQIQKFRLKGSKTNLVMSIVGFGSCGKAMRESFEITMSIGKRGSFLLAMTPTDEAITPYFSRVDLTLDNKDYLPRRIELHETSGDTLVFEFSHLDKNIKMEEAMFDLVVPKGFEVVEY